MWKDKEEIIAFSLFVITIALIIFIIAGCKSQQVPLVEKVEIVKIDTIKEIKTDSIYISSKEIERVVNDTIYRLRFDTIYAFRYIDKDKVKYEYIHDSIPYKVEVPIEVHKRNGYDKFVSWGFWIFIFLLLIRIAYKVLKLKYGKFLK